MGKPILCLDFDGVLHSYSSGWKGADVISDAPTSGASNWDADGNTGDYYRGLHDAYEAVQQIATGYQPALYAVFLRPHEGQPK